MRAIIPDHGTLRREATVRDDVDLVESVLAKDVRLLENVPHDRLDPTAYPDYDVAALVRHMAGWVRVFAVAANERRYDGDPAVLDDGADPVAVFRDAADELVRGWRAHGTDRPIPFFASELPGSAALAMTLMEYVTHGCDLALATGQDVPFDGEELETTLARARTMLRDESRRGTAFGPPVPVPDDAPAVDRLLGFMGRPSGAWPAPQHRTC